MRAYTYAALLTAVAVGLLTLAGRLNFGNRQGVIMSIVGLVAAVLALVAGYWATATALYRFIGYVIGLNPWLRLAIAVGLVVGLFLAVEAVLPQNLAPGSSVAVPVVLVLLVLPSALAQGAIPGKFGRNVSHVVNQISEPARQQTSGWFG